MARRPASPARTLTIFFISVAVLYGLVALGGSWKPALGLDLEGGTRIRLAATGNDVTAESLREAADIIDNRVNGSGVSEAEVTTEGNQYIVVEIPGQSRRDLVDTVKRQAQLRFRVVAMSGVGTAAPTAAAEPERERDRLRRAHPVDVARWRGAAAQRHGRAHGDRVADQEGDGQEPSPLPGRRRLHQRRPVRYGDAERHRQPVATARRDSPTASPTDGATDGADAGTGGIDDPLTWMDAPDEKSVAAYNAYSCSTPVQAVGVNPRNGKTVPGDKAGLADGHL